VCNVDPEGELPVNFIKCAYYSKKIGKYSKMCDDELAQLHKKYSDCPGQADFEFMDKYESGFLPFALMRCAGVKCPDKKLYENWMKACVGAGVDAIFPPKPM